MLRAPLNLGVEQPAQQEKLKVLQEQINEILNTLVKW